MMPGKPKLPYKTAAERRKYQRAYYLAHKDKAKEYQRIYNRQHKKKQGHFGKGNFEMPREAEKTSFSFSNITQMTVGPKFIETINRIISGEFTLVT